MAEKKIIAVTGATAAQAGGLARAILNDPSREFALRAVTRDPNKEAARALADRGAAVVQADLDDEASLRSAFDGAYGAYCLTNFWEHFNGEKETCQSRGLTGLVPRMGVGYSFYSTVYPGTPPLPFNSIVAQLGAAAPGVGFGRRASSCIKLYTAPSSGSKVMKHLMVLLIAIVVPAAAMTDGGCRDDVQKFCMDVGEAKRAVVACLQQHMAELSEECKIKLSQQPS